MTLRKTLEADDKEEIKKKTEQLSEKLQKVGAQAYEQPEQSQAPNETKSESESSTSGNDEKKKEEPVEGEVVE